MSEPNKLVSHDHDYDGIQEYDNPTPRWWNFLLFGSIIFSAWYLAYYWGKGVVLKENKPNEEMTAWSTSLLDHKNKTAEALMGSQPVRELSEEELKSYLSSASSITSGAKLFKDNCVSCHGDQGQGIIGPNLTDEYWLSGNSPADIIKAIAEGFPAKGMVAWKPVLGVKKVRDLTAFVMSIEGNEVPNPKEPQGSKK